LSLLGKEKTAEDYYSNNDPSILRLKEMQWYILVQNFMQKVQYVLVKVKVLNSTMTRPDAVTCTPSPQQAIMNFSVFLTDSQSSIIPFFWEVADYSLQRESLVLERLIINGTPVTLRISGVNGLNFFIVFELWYFYSAREEFRFDWDTPLGFRCAWNQMLFNVIVSQ